MQHSNVVSIPRLLMVFKDILVTGCPEIAFRALEGEEREVLLNNPVPVLLIPEFSLDKNIVS